MKTILIAGSFIVTLALLSYSIGIFYEQRKKNVNRLTLIFLGLGLLFDISGTVCMIIGSSNHAFTIHGIIGYSALFGMFIDNILLWNIRIKNGKNAAIPLKIHIYSLIAYSWWAIVYLSGIIMAVNR